MTNSKQVFIHVNDRQVELETNLFTGIMISIFVLFSIIQIDKVTFLKKDVRNNVLYSLLIFSIVYLALVTSKYGFEFYTKINSKANMFEKICTVFFILLSILIIIIQIVVVKSLIPNSK